MGGTQRAIVLALLNVTLALQMSTVLEAQWWLRNLYAVFGGVSPGDWSRTVESLHALDLTGRVELSTRG